MVNIEYTGVNGKTTRFGSSSANDAMKRLRGISGYNGNVMDSAAAGLAEAFAAKHKNAARLSEMYASRKSRFAGVPAENLFSSGDGTVAKLPSLAGLTFENGRLVATKQDKFVNDAGAVVSSGNRRHENVAVIPTMEAVRSQAEKTAAEVAKTVSSDTGAASAAEIAKTVAAEYVSSQKAAGDTVEVITNISFDASGPLKIVVERTPVTITSAGSPSTQEFEIGEEVMVHESMSMDRHSYVYVISRRSNVSSIESKTQN